MNRRRKWKYWSGNAIYGAAIRLLLNTAWTESVRCYLVQFRQRDILLGFLFFCLHHKAFKQHHFRILDECSKKCIRYILEWHQSIFVERIAEVFVAQFVSQYIYRGVVGQITQILLLFEDKIILSSIKIVFKSFH